MVGWYAHRHMLLFLEVANRDPSGNLVECADGADVAEDESHKTTDETTVSPAGGLEGRPEVAAQTTFAWLAVVQKKAISAAHPIVVEVMNDGHLEIEGGLISVAYTHLTLPKNRKVYMSCVHVSWKVTK